MDLKTLALAHIDAQNSHDLELILSGIADDALYQGFPGGHEFIGIAEIRGHLDEILRRIPDLHLEPVRPKAPAAPAGSIGSPGEADLQIEPLDSTSGPDQSMSLLVDESQKKILVRCELTGTDEALALDIDGDAIDQQLALVYSFNDSGKITAAVSYFERSGLDLYCLTKDHIRAENRSDLSPEERAELALTTVADDASYLIFPTGQELKGKEQLFEYYRDSFRALPDLYIDIQHMIKDEGRRQVIAQYRITGHDKGHLQGLLPTESQVEYYGNILYEFNKVGKITKEVTYFDKTEVLHTLGLIKNSTTDMGVFLLFSPQSPLYSLRLAWNKLMKRSRRI